MPSIFSHAVAATAMGQWYPKRALPARFWIWTAISSMLPDADVISFAFGVPYGDLLGHRGITHSLFFAVVVGALVARIVGAGSKEQDPAYVPLTIYFALVMTSHGLLDALTNGGSGIAFFAPFDSSRYFLPWRPIQVSPIGMGFFSARGMAVLFSELGWIWLPAALLGLLGKHRS